METRRFDIKFNMVITDQDLKHGLCAVKREDKILTCHKRIVWFFCFPPWDAVPGPGEMASRPIWPWPGRKDRMARGLPCDLFAKWLYSMRRSGCECTTMDDYDKEDEEDGGENAMVNCERSLIGVGPRKLVVGYLELKHNRPITIDTASEALRVDKKCLFSSGPQRCGHYKKLFQG